MRGDPSEGGWRILLPVKLLITKNIVPNFRFRLLSTDSSFNLYLILLPTYVRVFSKFYPNGLKVLVEFPVFCKDLTEYFRT